MTELLKKAEASSLRENIDEFNIGDTVKVHYKIIEGKNERIQVFEAAR